MKVLPVAVCFAVTVGLVGPVVAGDHGHHGDIEVELNGSQLATEGRVFEAVLGKDGFPYMTDDPGFEGDPGVFSPGSTIGFNIVDALGRWNGNGFDMLDPFNQESLSMAFGPASATTSVGFVTGFNFVNDASNGFDVHLDFALHGSGGNPADGIYLLALQLTSNNYDTSETFWIVFDNGLGDDVLDMAVDWVQANLVPTPGAISLLLVSAFPWIRRRR